jgi:chemotaxis protein MotB
MAPEHTPHLGEEDESYFVSMTDLMVGMLFIFIIMLMAFALNYREAQQTRETINEKLTGARKARDQMLGDIKRILERRGVRVEIDPENGVLRLKADLLFEKGESTLTGEGHKVIGHVTDALWIVLPCYANARRNGPPNDCPTFKGGRLEAVFIEGHTDSDPFATGAAKNNWILSTERAISTYKKIIANQPNLEEMRNDSEQHLLGVSGYEARRPTPRLPGQSDEEKKAADRRIDLRFIMTSPKPEPLTATEKLLRERAPR